MALKKANQEIPCINRKKMDSLVRDLAMEITVGGDRFDRSDFCAALLQAGIREDSFDSFRGKVIEKAKTMQPDGDKCVDFFNKSLDFWLDRTFFESIRERMEYNPSPVPYENNFLSTKEADFTVQLERELHSDYCQTKFCEGWVPTGRYDMMLYRALPLLNDELNVSGKILRNTDKGYVYDGKNLSDYPVPDRIVIATNALGAAGIQDKVRTSDFLKEWEDLPEHDRMFFYDMAWSMMKSYKALGYTLDDSRSFLGVKRVPTADRAELIDKIGRQMHGIDAKKMNCFDSRHIPYEKLSNNDRWEYTNMAEVMLNLMDRKKLRPVLQKNIAKKAKMSSNVSL